LHGASVGAVAHRVVHGGTRFTAHTLLDNDAVEAIGAASELAPLHNAAALAAIRAARRRLPDRPHVACFDTAFHASLPEVARREPVPEAWHELGIRRFGFHGLSVEWSVGRAAALLGREPADLDLVVAHLGGGASVTAVNRAASAWSSMGYTPNDGIMMGSRSGSLDPAIVTEMIERHGLSPAAVASALEHDAGLAGVSGRSGDVRELEASAAAGDSRARIALDLFAARAAAGIAAAATWLSRIDGVVFTGGIGENAGPVRAAIVGRLGILGLTRIEEAESGRDRVLAPGPPASLRVEAREELVMARAAVRFAEV
jgi:acetate kinase